jgi:hypothetical protein
MNIIIVDPTETAPENVAKKRAAARAAAQEYHQLKVKTLHEMGRVMSATGDWYTAGQLAKVSGLTSGEVAAQFGYDGRFKAAVEAGLCGRVHTDVRRLTRRFVEVDEGGNPIDDRIYEQHRKVIVYGASEVDGITCNR